MKILALGNSYTIGEGVSVSESWPVQLAESLNQKGIDIEDLKIIAQTGWRTDELLGCIESSNPEKHYPLVTLLIGVNNQYRGCPADEYRLDFRELLQKAVAFAGDDPTRVIVLSIPDWGVTPFAEGRDRGKIALEIDLFNAANLEETCLAGAHYVDVTPISRMAGGNSEYLAPDGLHPSGCMYAEWVKLILPKAIQILVSTQVI
ncbi:MAG: SGNH/GDSL hydrolase family protein [Anaerolineaceae bacterium]|jgi:lysophospholipase L1-like esterase|nr:SGNH/GDSL hydrolase family protein [Anaerolineaceae bacterium]